MDPDHEPPIDECLFPAIEQALDLFDLPENVDFFFEPVAETDNNASWSGAIATTGAAELSPASPTWDNGFPGAATLLAARSPSIVREEPTCVVPAYFLVPFKDRKRPTHVLPRAKPAQWDWLWERLR